MKTANLNSMFGRVLSDPKNLRIIMELNRSYNWMGEEENEYYMIDRAYCASEELIEDGRFLVSLADDRSVVYAYAKLGNVFNFVQKMINHGKVKDIWVETY